MLKDIVSVKPLEDFRLLIRFEDGVEGVFDLQASGGFDGIFAPLGDREYFARVTVNAELGTVVWPNGADLDPVVLYAAVTGRPRPDMAATARERTGT